MVRNYLRNDPATQANAEKPSATPATTPSAAVVNPLRELGLERFRVPSDWRSLLFGSKIADLYVQPHIGGDTAWFKAVLKALLESESLDYGFIDRASSGWRELAAELAASSWNELVAAAGVGRYEVDRAAEMIAAAESGEIGRAHV